MIEGWTAVPPELPGAREGRELAEILAAPDTPEQRAAVRAEKLAARNRQAEREQPDTQQWLARMRGQEAVTPAEVLQRFEGVRDPGGIAPQDLARARRILEEHGLAGVLPARVDAVLDPHMGYLGSPPRQADPGESREDAALRARAEQLDEDRRWMRRFQARHPDTAVRAQKIANEKCTGPDCAVCREGQRLKDAQRGRPGGGGGEITRVAEYGAHGQLGTLAGERVW